MWCCTFKQRWHAIVLSAGLTLWFTACPMYNNGSNALPDGYSLSGIGPFEETPFELCQGSAQLTGSDSAIAVPQGFSPPQCNTKADCPERSTCQCGVCLAQPCSTRFDCGLGDCVDGHCLQQCNPNASNSGCPEGYFCSKTYKVCRPRCETNADCAPAELCVESEDGEGKVCMVAKLSERQEPPQGTSRLNLSLDISPECPSIVRETDKLVLFFVVRKRGIAQVYTATATVPTSPFEPLRFYTTLESPVVEFDSASVCPDVARLETQLYLFFNLEDGIYALKLSDELVPVSDPVQILAGEWNSPDVISTDNGALMVIRQADQAVFAVPETDDPLEPWRLLTNPVLDLAKVESTQSPVFAPCASTKNCQDGLYCAIAEDETIGRCLPDKCGACPAPSVCQDGRCVCPNAAECPPEPYPVWLNVQSLESAALLKAADHTVVFFAAKGSTSVAGGKDFSIGAAVLTESSLTLLETNPVFDRMVLTLHKDEISPEPFAAAGAVFLIYSDGRRLRAARCPQQPLVEF